MVKLLLVRPDLVGTPYAMRKFRVQHQPLGLLALAATSLQEDGVEVKIADEIVGDDAFQVIDSYKPDFVGISVPTTLFLRSNKIGEFGIGTNFGIKKFTKNILFDEKIGGTFHLAIGFGFPETGSKNRSGIHWDLICELGEKGQIVVDGEPLFKDGNFVLWNNN